MNDHELGELQAEVRNVKEAVGEMRKDIKGILDTLAQARGGWKTLLLVAGIAGVMGAAVSKLVAFAAWLPK